MDWAHSSVTHAVLTGHFVDGTRWVVDEWYWDATDAGPLTEADQADRIRRWLGDKTISRVSIDPKAVQMWRALRQVLKCPVILADNEVGAGIQYLRSGMESGLLHVSRRCVNLIRQASNYSWDERAGLLGLDRPIKEDDHGVDGWRYDEWTGAGPKRQVRVIRSRQRARTGR